MPPLHGIRVIDLTRIVAGPYCTMMLGDMGAEVLKIEEPEHGDDSRGWGPYINGWSSFFLELNRSKKSVALDLKSDAGAQALRRLIETADVLIENFRPGSLAELGFDQRADRAAAGAERALRARPIDARGPRASAGEGARHRPGAATAGTARRDSGAGRETVADTG
jgi:hypothetical protein